MEVAKLILDYVSVLIWPVALLTIILWFRVPLGRVVERILSRSERIELEVGGQRLSIILGKEAVARREQAAAFVKGLDPPDQDKLATELGVPTGPGAVVNILTAISRAGTTKDFNVIAQQINVLFDKEI